MSLFKYGVVKEGAQQKVAFYLCNHFNMLPFISAVEPLRIANLRAVNPLYRWDIITADGEPVTASNGMQQLADFAVDQALSYDMVFVCGSEPTDFSHPTTINWLK